MTSARFANRAVSPAAYIVLATALVLASTTANASTGGTDDEIASLKRELRAQQAITQKIMRRLDAVSTAQHNAQVTTRHELDLAIAQARADSKAQITSNPAVPPGNGIEAGYKSGLSPRGISGFKSGYYISDESGDNTLYINGLLQPRFRFFEPSGTTKFGAKDQASNNFDVFLGRLYFSGSLVDPSFTYFFTLQGSTQSNAGAPGITLLDAEVAKTFSPYLKVEMGRYWSAYTYEYYLDIGKYLFPGNCSPPVWRDRLKGLAAR